MSGSSAIQTSFVSPLLSGHDGQGVEFSQTVQGSQQPVTIASAAANSGPAAILGNGDRNIDMSALLHQIREQGYIGVALFDDPRSKMTGSHMSHMENQFWDSIPAQLKPYIRLYHIPFYDGSGHQRLGQATAELERYVQQSKVQMVFSAGDLRDDPTLQDMSRWTGRNFSSTASMTRADLAQGLASFRNGQPTEAGLVDRINNVAGRVPFLEASGNGSPGLLDLASATIHVGATDGRGGAEVYPAGYSDVLADGRLTVASFDTPSSSVTSYATAHYAGTMATFLLKQAGGFDTGMRPPPHF